MRRVEWNFETRPEKVTFIGGMEPVSQRWTSSVTYPMYNEVRVIEEQIGIIPLT